MGLLGSDKRRQRLLYRSTHGRRSADFVTLLFAATVVDFVRRRSSQFAVRSVVVVVEFDAVRRSLIVGWVARCLRHTFVGNRGPRRWLWPYVVA